MTTSPRFATPNAAPADLMTAIEACGRKLADVRAAIGAVIFGQDEVIDQSLTAILSGGHMLLIGVPGLAKTRLVETLGAVLGLNPRRIQCTPDLMPSDILGAEVMEESESGRRAFRFIQGPVFCQLLMADEINRASPRTQSALLQAMQERQVTVAGHTYPLPAPFHVMATQNPLEQEGTYPLPEAQLDRFLLQIDITYPDLAAERQILLATTIGNAAVAKPVLSAADLQELQNLVRRMPISEKTVEGILALVRQGRPESSRLEIVKKYVVWGPGPRASQALSLAARARALLDGRLSPSLDDVLALAKPALQHRMALGFAARAEGVTMETVCSLWRSRSDDGRLMKGALHHRAEGLAALLPPLLVEAECAAQSVWQGSHNRRRAGAGEDFWQFRRYHPGDSAALIDWRQSARTDKLFVREREWAAAHSVGLWADASGSMRYASDKNLPTKADRAALLMLALASLLLRGGEKPLWAEAQNFTSVNSKTALERIATTMSPSVLHGRG